MINLAQNAVQHTGPGDCIAIGSALRGAWVYLWVSDCGPGIAPDDQRRIFERFERGSHSRYEGSGLGLAIVQAIATTHGGSIQLTSAPGAGATFTLGLPPRPAPGTAIAQSTHRSELLDGALGLFALNSLKFGEPP
ncbi:MAG: HAMP domain-containing histidine kinase [Aphanocapsa lilacina HA4352-LM1]|nr:HAMP domain-containing histidine kinase [Aphanocapsa lilacina HA4352-LM1]